MTLREVLQIEIWSKRTTRKMMSVFGSLVVVLVVLYVIEFWWLTPPERKAARVALAKVDGLQKFGEMTDEEYGWHYQEAEAKIQAAEKASWTERDESTVVVLSNYLMFTDFRRSQEKSAEKLIGSKNERLRESGLTELQWSVSSTPISGLDSLGLHEALR